MITRIFDQGWGPEWPWKKFETKVINQMLAKIHSDDSLTVIVNSVWYTDTFHDYVMSWLRNNSWDRIVLISMLDAPIPRPEWYSEFDRPVVTVGYYSGKNQIDLCAIFLADHIDLTPYGNLEDTRYIDTAFLCLNRKPHWHRRRLYKQLKSFDLLDHGIVTMGSEDGRPLRSLTDDIDVPAMSPNSAIEHYGIPNDVISLGPAHTWHRCFFNVVTETVWNINQVGFVSEKIYKPILGMRPFVVYDTDGGCQWLQDRGFQTYQEDFSDISDHDPSNPDQLVFFMRDLVRQPKSYFPHKLQQLLGKIKYNFDNFQKYISIQKTKIQLGIDLTES